MDARDIDPISIFLVKKGCASDRLLFRYPYATAAMAVPASATTAKSVATAPVIPTTINTSTSASEAGASSVAAAAAPPAAASSRLDHNKCCGPDSRNPYSLSANMLVRDPFLKPNTAAAAKVAAAALAAAVTSSSSPLPMGCTGPLDLLKPETLPEFSSKVLSNLFAVHPGLCDDKFELKISEVRFIGHPMSLEVKNDEARYYANKRKSPLTMFNVVFALRASAPYSVVECYHDLCRHIAAAIRNEERRVGYLTAEARTMDEAADHAASMPDDQRVSAFELAQERSQLARDLKEIYDNMRQSGAVYLRINKYIEVNFCVPQKVFHRLNPCLEVDRQAIFDCMEFLKPYHTFLLLHEPKELLSQLPLDGSPPLYKLVRAANPTMSFRALASETMIPLVHIFELAGHLLYWGKATVIYPVCENNVYIISPKISNVLTPTIKERFAEKFPGESFVQMLSMFNSPMSISHRQHLHNPAAVQLLGRVIVFFLQQHLIVQIHTYVSMRVGADATVGLPDPVRKKFGLAWCVARHLGDVSATKGTGGDIKHVAKDPLKLNATSQEDVADKDNALNEILKSFSEDEKKAIVKAAVPCATLEDYELFAKIAPYLNGRYHIEEILYFANMKRAELMKVLDCFIDILTIQEHEDTAVTSYYDKSVRNYSSR